METFSALLAICAGNSPVSDEFPTQRPVTHSFDVYFDLRPNKRLSKQSLGWWFETLSPPLWRHRNGKVTDTFISHRMDYWMVIDPCSQALIALLNKDYIHMYVISIMVNKYQSLSSLSYNNDFMISYFGSKA